MASATDLRAEGALDRASGAARLAVEPAEEPAVGGALRGGGRARKLAPSARSILVGSPREVLARLAAHDPLGVRAIVGRRIAERFLLLDADRVQLASLARIARDARRYRGTPALEVWLTSEVDAAIDALLEDEARIEGSRALEPRIADGAARGDEVRETGAWRDLARPLGLAASEMRGACARFNALPCDEREAFVRLVLERRSADELARTSGRSLTELARRARRGIEAVLAPCGAMKTSER